MPDSPDPSGDHECLFQPWDVAFARTQAASVFAQAPLWRACVLCGMWVDLVAVAEERLVDQRTHP